MRYVLIGHLCKDLLQQDAGEEEKWQPGGTVLYSGRMAAQLGGQTTVITRCQLVPQNVVDDYRLEWQRTLDIHTTTFFNEYDPQTGKRRQYLLARAGAIALDEITLHAPNIIHLAPVASEIDIHAAIRLRQRYAHSWLVATPQGWMRQVDGQKQVAKTAWESAYDLLPHLKAVAFSEEDVEGNIEIARAYAQTGTTVLYTRGANGSILFHEGKEIAIKAAPADVVDVTGAGDVIAAAFFVRYFETGDAYEAALFGTVAAAISIEYSASTGVPTRHAVNQRRSQVDAV